MNEENRRKLLALLETLSSNQKEIADLVVDLRRQLTSLRWRVAALEAELAKATGC